MHAKIRFALPLLPVLLIGCNHEPVSSPISAPVARGAGGLMEITITGIGTPQQRASARPLVAEPGGAAVAPAVTRGGRSWPAATLDAGRLSLLPSDGTIQLVGLSTASFTYGTRGAGGYRYVSATFQVRNATSGGTAYGTARNNLTLLGVSGTGNFATLNSTAIKTLNRFDGSASPADARTMRPTGWADLSGSATISSRAPDVLQIYTEAEVAPANFTPPAGVNIVLPYGFVVRTSSSADRTMAANPGASQFDGLLTVAYKVPLQATATDDPYTITGVFLAVDDAETIVTQSLEDSDAASTAAAALRAAGLTGATMRSLLGSWVANRSATFMCTARTAGTVGTPTALLADTITVSSVSPAAGSSALGTAQLSATFSQIMNGALASYTSYAVNGSQSGRAFRTGSFTGGGTATLQSPTPAFLAGEQVTVALTPKLLGSTVAGARVCPYVYQYRVTPSVASGSFTLSTPAATADSGPQSIAVGDMDGDGNLDVVVGNALRKSISTYSTAAVIKGDGLGGVTFLDTTGVLGSHPYGIAVGDINGDGKLDVVATLFDNGSAARMLNDGTGIFPLANVAEFAVAGNGDGPIGIVLADVNGDGNLDVITANFNGGSVSVLLGDGTGGFTPAIGSPTLTGGNGTIAVAVGDVNNDHKLDIVAANLNSSNVTVLLGDGTGRFTANTPITVNGPPQGIALGYFNAGTNLDLATANTSANNVTVLSGNGSGGFSPVASSPFSTGAGTFPMSIAAGDVDGNGTIDLVTADSTSGEVSVLSGDGTGGFTASNITIGAGTQPAAVALAPMVKATGKLAIITANARAATVTVLWR
jgi:hypothetical protein